MSAVGAAEILIRYGRKSFREDTGRKQTTIQRVFFAVLDLGNCAAPTALFLFSMPPHGLRRGLSCAAPLALGGGFLGD